MSLWEKFAACQEEQMMLVCSSTHHLLSAEKVLVQAGITAKVVPVPAGLVTHCSSGLEFPQDEEKAVRSLIQLHKIEHEGIFKI